MLTQLSKKFELAVYSMGTIEYVTAIVNLLDPSRKMFKHILHREDSIYDHRTNEFYKDLRLFYQGRSNKDVLIIDNKD